MVATSAERISAALRPGGLATRLAKCYILHFFVMHMASVLRDFQEHLFGTDEAHRKTWEEIGSLDGAPERGPDFETKEYAFLLDGSSKNPMRFHG